MEAPESEELHFFVEDVDYSLPYPESTLMHWLHRLAAAHQGSIGALTYIFCSDEYLHKINVDYLQHDTYTDIITFDQSDSEDHWEGDIFISVERVADNALDFGVKPEQELLRVMAHGLLHIMGYGDKSPEEAQEMRLQEEQAIALFE